MQFTIAKNLCTTHGKKALQKNRKNVFAKKITTQKSI